MLRKESSLCSGRTFQHKMTSTWTCTSEATKDRASHRHRFKIQGFHPGSRSMQDQLTATAKPPLHTLTKMALIPSDPINSKSAQASPACSAAVFHHTFKRRVSGTSSRSTWRERARTSSEVNSVEFLLKHSTLCLHARFGYFIYNVLH